MKNVSLMRAVSSAKRAFALIPAIIILFQFLCMPVFATNVLDFVIDTGNGGGPMTLNSDNKLVSKRFSVDHGGSAETVITTPEYCSFKSTYYFLIDEPDMREYLSNTKYFTTSISNKKNLKYLESNPRVTTRRHEGIRYDAIEVKFAESGSKEEQEVGFTMNFRATSRTAPNGMWQPGDEFQVRFRLYASNEIDDSGNADLDAGNTVVFKPHINDDNSVTWGATNYPIASLEFEASSDADDFYAKLSTKSDSRIYDRYGDPADAELFFRTFSGDNIDATSRGTLTLYNPWVDDRYNYSPDPMNIWIYRINGDELEDVTGKFEYVREDDTPEGIEGWQTRTRVLDAYVISDKDLLVDDPGNDWEDNEDVLPPVIDEGDPITPDLPGGTGQEIPSTGSHDFVVVALIAGVAAVAIFFVAKRKKH